MTFSADDHAHMAEALRLAAQGLCTTTPNPRVGCVIVRDGEVVGRGFHARAGEPHAEVHALREAGDRARGATAYVTLEPCAHHGRTPPCADALLQAGVRRVVSAVGDPNPLVGGQGLARLAAAGVETASGLLAGQAAALNAGFLRRIAGGLPWVRLKLASSLDGRTAMASGESQWITGAAARQDVQQWRARSCAILTGMGTVRDDDPALTVRDADNRCDGLRQPLRVVLDTDLQLPVAARVLTQPGSTWVMTPAPGALADEALVDWLTDADPPRGERARALLAAGVRLMGIAGDDAGRPDIREVLRVLADAGCNEVLVEAGATIAGSCLRAGVVDEVLLYQATTLMGSSGRPLAVWPMTHMHEQLRLACTDVRLLGDDLRLTLRPVARDGQET